MPPILGTPRWPQDGRGYAGFLIPPYFGDPKMARVMPFLFFIPPRSMSLDMEGVLQPFLDSSALDGMAECHRHTFVVTSDDQVGLH